MDKDGTMCTTHTKAGGARLIAKQASQQGICLGLRGTFQNIKENGIARRCNSPNPVTELHSIHEAKLDQTEKRSDRSIP